MKKNIVLLLLFIGFTVISCSDDFKIKKLDGKWKLKYIESADGAIHPVDTVFYNFLNSLFTYQLYNSTNDSYYQWGGFKTEEDKSSFCLEFDPEGEDPSLFLHNTDWEKASRVFTIEKHTVKTLILKSDGKRYTFQSF